ncbi:hypothetical protein [Pseudobacteriovorax antillogorgiicola]|uniref:Uncharacterized protein n=1 Tax=Pseudobacteriovorax antillogorgiicola TaxID=1513793 RepID=A0A1Y6BZZ5_9BACT|nr:hypothetical protein [Pseudobacteriovorax antillogorgiicola]TCS52370.1 hypothetical protein EDD56_109115 [Pseudobacteriovorax antillogorgiicola]SMF29378.1 hypothetical protein SAMN06296036_10998 [Pseudobacteriovorax antillogorgiicola]
MSQSFCKFLVHDGCISADDLVNAFIKQAQANPSLPTLLFENRILSEDEMLQVYAHQAQNEVSFEQSCRDLKIWSKAIDQKLEAVIIKEVPSIFRILVDEDLISLEDLTVKMDEYISNVIEDPEAYGLSAAS